MNQPSRLEILPDEIFLDLFSYIHPSELYHVWLGLNRRLSAIINSIRISFDLTENTIEYINALNYFSWQIIFMHLRVNSDLLDLRQYPNLRSLIVDKKLTRTQLEAIQPKFLPFLTRLTVCEQLKDDDILNDMIFNRVISTKQHCSWLKVYHLPSVPWYFTINTSSLSNIETMIFDNVKPCEINLILLFQPNLRRLRITIVHWMSQNPVISNDSLLNKNYQHKHLIDFNATLNTRNKLDSLYPLLSHLPCLRYLNVACDSLGMSDFQRLASELNAKLPCLQRFNCSFKQTYINDMEKVHCLSPLFHRMKCKKIEWNGGWHYYCVTTRNI